MFYISQIKVNVMLSLCHSNWLWDRRPGFKARQKKGLLSSQPHTGGDTHTHLPILQGKEPYAAGIKRPEREVEKCVCYQIIMQ